MIDFDENTNCEHCNKNCIVQFLTPDDVAVLNQNKSEIYYSPGQIITKQSSFSSKILFVVSGLVKVVKEGKGGKNTIVKILRENSFLAIPLHENQKKYSYTTIALTDVNICEISETFIYNSIFENQKLKDLLLDSYYEDLVFFINKLHLLNTRNNHGKLSASLIYLNNYSNPNFCIFDFITRKDLAELSSISLESVNKILQELKSDKIIDITNKGIQLNRIDLLEKLSNIG